MTAISAFLPLILGLILGALAAVVALRTIVSDRQARIDELTTETDNLRARLQAAELARTSAETRSQMLEKQRAIDGAGELRAAASAALKDVSEHLLTLAAQRFGQEREANDNVITPLREQMAGVLDAIKDLEQTRVKGAAEIQGVLDTLRALMDTTQAEARKLANVLNDPTVRGQWGEIALTRIVELAGMTQYCDFDTQKTHYGEDKQRTRPDMVIHIPGNISLPVDAKVPLTAYQAACEASDPDAQRQFLAESASALRNHVNALAARRYDQVTGNAGFTILFVPLESMLTSLLAFDPSIVNDAAERRIHIASPLTLLTYLRAFSRGWMLLKNQENAEAVVKYAGRLHERLLTMIEGLSDLGDSLRTAVKRYNGVIGSFEGRVLVSARQLATLTSASQPLPEPPTLEALVREPKPTKVAAAESDMPELFSPE